MRKVASGLLAGLLALTTYAALASPARAEAASPQDSGGVSLTPYDPATYTDLYRDPNGPITGSTYIFNPTANFDDQISYDFAHMRDEGVNTIGFYNLVQMTDSDRDVIFDNLERNHQKAVVRIEWYDGSTFKFDYNDPTHHDANSVLSYYNSDDPTHGYTALLNYLIRTGRLNDIAYFAINMPVDDGSVTAKFVTAQYPDGRSNPAWAASQAPYADYLIAGLRDILGGPSQAKLYLSVFYGWDQSYPTPSYADIAHPADGYFLNNYSYPISTPPDENASPSTLINQPRLQTAMDKMMGQYPTQPKVVEYGFHTVQADNGVIPNQTAGLVQTIEAKKLALADTTAFYQNGSSNGLPFNVRGTLYFAQNLYDQEGNPPASMDWTLDYPATTQIDAADSAAVRYYHDGVPTPAPAIHTQDASAGQAVLLGAPNSKLEFYDLAASSMASVRYRSDRPQTLLLAVNGSVPRPVRFPAAPEWGVLNFAVDVPQQGALSLSGQGDGVLAIDWLRPAANLEAELGTTSGAVAAYSSNAASGGAGDELGGAGDGVSFAQVRGGSEVAIRYAAASPVTAALTVGNDVQSLTLPATGGTDSYATYTAATTVPAGATVALTRSAGAGDLRVDYLRVDGQYEAESAGGLYNGVHGIPLADASEGSAATSFDVVGASVVFTNVIGGTALTFRYSSAGDTSMTVIENGQSIPIDFPDTHGAFASRTIQAQLPQGTTVIVQRNSNNFALGLTIDWMRVSG